MRSGKAAARFFASATSTSPMVTFQPRLAKVSALAQPMPRAAPVIRTVLVSLFISSALLDGMAVGIGFERLRAEPEPRAGLRRRRDVTVPDLGECRFLDHEMRAIEGPVGGE